jgi:hypothetical protein
MSATARPWLAGVTWRRHHPRTQDDVGPFFRLDSRTCLPQALFTPKLSHPAWGGVSACFRSA